MSPLQQLVALGLLSIRDVCEERKIKLLDTAAQILSGDLAENCAAQAVCLRSAREHQLNMENLLKEAIQP